MSDVSQVRLLIIQPYIPEYRVPFFRALGEALHGMGVDLALAAALSTGTQAARRDDKTSSVAEFILPERGVGVGSKRLLWRSTRKARHASKPDLIIVEQAIKNLENWPLLIASDLGRSPRVAMWGQGRSYSTVQSPLEAAAKQWLTRRADWFFAYTSQGAQHVIERGFPSDRVTVVKNSTDTRTLVRDFAAVTSRDLAEFQERHGLRTGKTGLFIGGVDERKGINFLLESAIAIERRVKGFRLLVAGSGDMASRVIAAEGAGAPVAYLGRVDGVAKAVAFAASDVVLNPEWVGLVAVDALACGLPTVTTRHPSHSPEFEYLVDGQTAIVTDHAVESFAQATSHVLLHGNELRRMSRAAESAGRDFSVEEMARLFSDGVAAWAYGL